MELGQLLDDLNYRTAVSLILKSVTEGTPKHETVLVIGATPLVLTQVGLPALPLVITGKTIDKVHFDHGITKGVIERLHDIVSAPRSVYKSAPPHLSGSVVVTFEHHRQSPIIVSIRASKQFGRSLSANEITSVYAKEGGTFEQRWRNEGLLLWEITNK